MTSDYRFAGFERRQGRLLARFRSDSDERLIALHPSPVPVSEAEEPLTDPDAQRELLARAHEWLALARTAHHAFEHPRERRPGRGSAG